MVSFVWLFSELCIYEQVTAPPIKGPRCGERFGSFQADCGTVFSECR